MRETGTAGILSTVILGLSALVSYEKNLKEFLADLNAEESSSLEASTSRAKAPFFSEKGD